MVDVFSKDTGIRGRLGASAGVLVLAAVLDDLLAPGVTIGSAEFAGRQFENSDVAAVTAHVGISFFSGVGGVVSLVALLALAVIWWPVLARFWRLGVVALALVGVGSPAMAYSSTTDKTEAVTIMPNESAFWIPDAGANRDTQTNMDSEAYLAANKIALKRFIIPHAKLTGSGGWAGFDAYVPSGRMIIVDRAPYNREWVKAKDRGTAPRDESFPCQSNDGLNITAEVSIAASVTEENSPKFLHFFGVNNPSGDRTQPEVIFTSVYYGRSLTQVMDGIGRGFVQTLVCHEIGAVDFETANKNYNSIMDVVRASATKFLGDRGITLDYIGWAGTWTFDADVQRAVNDRYTGEKVAPVLATLQAKAAVDAMEGWDHHLPASVTLSWWPENLGSAIGGLFRGK